MRQNTQRGFSLIEVAVVIAVLGVMMSIALPAVTDWIVKQRVRSIAEGMVNGLQLARAEAVRSNTLVDLQIGADGISWNIVLNGGTTPIQTRAAEASGNITATAYTNTLIALPATVTFNGLGRMFVPNTGAFSINYASTISGVRAMCATVTTNTPKLCDPLLTDPDDPRSCFIRDTSGNRVKVLGC